MALLIFNKQFIFETFA